MKQWIVFIGVILLSGTALEAQTFKATLLGGFNMSQIEGDRLAGYRKLGLSAGAKISADISERWSLSTELAFSQQGARRGVADYSSSFESIHFNFVEVPVLAHFSDWKLKVGAGFSYARLIDSEVISFSGEDVTELFPWRENQWAIVFDGLYAFSEKWALNIRWSRQLSTLLDDDEQNSLGVIDPNAPEPIPFYGFMVTTRVGYTF